MFSAAVQHHHASTFISEAVRDTDLKVGRGNARYETALIDEIYRRRTAYVQRLAVSARNNHHDGDASTFDNIVRNRLPVGRKAAQVMLARR